MSQEKLSYLVSIETHVGGRAENQDYAAELDVPLGKLVLICDGMGGAKGGALASEVAALAVINAIKNTNLSVPPLTALRQAVEAANAAVFELSKADSSLRGMGTTIAALLIGHNHQAYVAHVGDSRVYQFSKSKLIFRTKDHSWVQEMVDRGQINPEEARLHPDSNRITRALGIKDQVEVEINLLNVKLNDVFVLTSDGIHGEIEEKEMSRVLKRAKRVFDVSHELAKVAAANGQISKNGRHDNLTIAAVALKSYRFGRVDRDMLNNIILLLCLVIAGGIVYYAYPTIIQYVTTSSKSVNNATQPKQEGAPNDSIVLPDKYKNAINDICKAINTDERKIRFKTALKNDRGHLLDKYITIKEKDSDCTFLYKKILMSKFKADSARIDSIISELKKNYK